MFYITDRVKELIKYKGPPSSPFDYFLVTLPATNVSGFQVPPASLEGLLASHPKVLDVAVIGIYSPSLASEVPRAYIVPSVAASKELADELIKFVYDRVAQHKRLRGGVRFIEEVPKSGSGKILRRVLKEEAKKEEGDPMVQMGGGKVKAKL
jgi:acyl-coenzyme A synthetase/AMP-(fatty) acid ligase